MARIKYKTDPDRILQNVDFSISGCWLWQLNVNNCGYGMVYAPNQKDGSSSTVVAHRVAYKLFVGDIPKDLQVDHLCRVRKCVNPDHLEVVTSLENMRRGNNATKRARLITHCPQNHEYSEANTYRYGNNRKCKTCDLTRSKSRWQMFKQNRKAGVPSPAV